MSTHDIESRLLAQLVERKGEWQEIAKGSGVSYSWLSKFVNRHIPNPGYRTLRQLDAYLRIAEKEAEHV